MFTNNWYKALYSCMAEMKDNSVQVVDLTGVTRTAKKAFESNKNFSMNQTVASNGYCYGPSMKYLRKRYTGSESGVILGNGNTPPTLQDYKLSGNLITSYEYSSSVSSLQVEEGIEITATYTITNTGSENMTISEIGMIAPVCSGSTTAADGSYVNLVERTVLETPVTIPAGGVGQVTYTIRMNYPTA